MSQPEFDRLAAIYRDLHAENIRLSGESPEYFSRYKIEDAVRVTQSLLVKKAILDFGTGIGNSIPFLRNAFPDCNIAGLDVSSRSLELAMSHCEGMATFHHYDGQQIPFASDTFGMVFTACVFHHIDHDEHIQKLQEIRRVLARGGWMFLYEHNPWNPLTAKAVRECPLDEHAKLIPAPAMRRRAEAAGFRNIRSHYRVFFPAPLAPLRPIERLLCWLPLGAQYFLACRK